ncbi:hypothetical protein B0H15DRAFT_972986 [Mycena belliarum]|uniref:Glycoside hydrolase family 38 central domain-containing protein n=1 Tax=Mycena belliarum TaxID=1033014 RepID=A0AAD6U5Z0_9AGAR|nr:hypothetical protein B0H15DRAFT_972986 [Mycena belliae]
MASALVAADTITLITTSDSSWLQGRMRPLTYTPLVHIQAARPREFSRPPSSAPSSIELHPPGIAHNVRFDHHGRCMQESSASVGLGRSRGAAFDGTPLPTDLAQNPVAAPVKSRSFRHWYHHAPLHRLAKHVSASLLATAPPPTRRRSRGRALRQSMRPPTSLGTCAVRLLGAHRASVACSVMRDPEAPPSAARCPARAPDSPGRRADLVLRMRWGVLWLGTRVRARASVYTYRGFEREAGISTKEIGGSWVENDANTPSGEALVRQLLFGQHYFQQKFGLRCQTAWLPDSFGLTGSLPQLIRAAGMKNNINSVPHATLNWYCVGDVNRAVSNHKNLESSDTPLFVFGNGDGGGGPLPKMLENVYSSPDLLGRMRAVTNTHRELPPVHMGRLVDEFFDCLSGSTGARASLPNRRGELYLEFFRGTYASPGSIEKGNGHSEILLRDVEHLATIASVERDVKYAYPRNKINECWEMVLSNPFHDVLPGSAIGMVYDDAEKLYAEVRKDGDDTLNDSFNIIFSGVAARLDPSARVAGVEQLVAYNTTPFARREVVRVPLPLAQAQAQLLGAQVAESGKQVFMVAHGPSGARAVGVETRPVTESWGSPSPVGALQVCWIRELLLEGACDGLVIFEDRPSSWDAWDVDHHLEKPTLLSFERVSVVVQGPLCAAVHAEVAYGAVSGLLVALSQLTGSICQSYYLVSLDAVPASNKADSRSLMRFDVKVDWHWQRHESLKFELPLNIHSETATYETQFGHLRVRLSSSTFMRARGSECGLEGGDDEAARPGTEGAYAIAMPVREESVRSELPGFGRSVDAGVSFPYSACARSACGA